MPSGNRPQEFAGGERREILDELTRLGQELGPHTAVVCTTHSRFVPCRKQDGCVISQDPEDVARVSAYQREAAAFGDELAGQAEAQSPCRRTRTLSTTSPNSGVT